MAFYEDGGPFEWAVTAHSLGAHCLRVLIRGIEHGAANLAIDRDAWDNTMLAVEWALREHAAGRVQGAEPVTMDDIAQLGRLRALGSAALAGGERSPELLALAEHGATLLGGRAWRSAGADLADSDYVYPHPSMSAAPA